MHYVMSDIHGQYAMYRMMLNRIDFSDDDTLYIIGDAIDRGPDPIPLLLDIMSRSNVVFLIGNHEHMMYGTLARRDMDEMHSWMLNGGAGTLEQFEALDVSLRKAVLRWLASRPLVIPSLSVNGRNYYLAHACHTLYPEKDILLYRDAGIQNIEHVVWSREYRKPDRYRQGFLFRRLYAEYPDTTLLIGHTPVYKCSYGIVTNNGSGRISKSCRGHLVNLDCGCASGRTLGCLRLEDGKEFYVDSAPKEKRRKKKKDESELS